VVRIEAGGNHTFAICDKNAVQQRKSQRRGSRRGSSGRSASTAVAAEPVAAGPAAGATAEDDDSAGHHKYTASEQFLYSKAMSSRPVNRMSYESLAALIGDEQTSPARRPSTSHVSSKRLSARLGHSSGHGHGQVDMVLLRKVMQASLFEMHTLNASFLAHPIDDRHRYHGTSTIPAPAKMSSSSSGLNVPAAVKAMDTILNVITTRSSSKEGEFVCLLTMVLVCWVV
jgi:hypothetical protein